MFVREIAAGGGHSLAINGLGEVYSWGDSAKGQLGHGDTTHWKYAKKLKYLKGIYF